MSNHHEFKLIQEIISRSATDTWDEAKREWALVEVYREEKPETCLCGHFPIIEICVLRNTKNDNEAIIGNVCVKKFLGLPSDLIFSAIGRISKDINRAVNADTVLHAHNRKWINDWDKQFYLDTCRKRSLSEKQKEKRVQINQKILHNTTNGFKTRLGK